MAAPVRTRIFASLLLALFLALVAVPRGVQSFAPSSHHQFCRCNNPLASTPTDENESSEVDESPPTPAVKCPNCDKCDGSGRIEGGIGTILTFWPIKAYRPCPNFIENGGFYSRAGQGLDEIAFGRDSKYNPMDQ